MQSQNPSASRSPGKRSLAMPPVPAGRDVSMVQLAPAGGESLVHAPAPGGTFRILLGLDLPVAALPLVEADWALVNSSLRDEPDAAPEAIEAALERLLEHAVSVSGVAIAEPLPNPLEQFQPRAA